VRVVIASALRPPVSEAITGELTGLLTGVQMDVADILFEIIEAVRNDHPLGQTGEIVVIGE
jgi:hypothetical protein